MLHQIETDAKAAKSAAPAAPASPSTLSWLVSLVTPASAAASPAAGSTTTTTNATAAATSDQQQQQHAERMREVTQRKQAAWHERLWATPLFGVSRLCKACKANDLATVKLLASADTVNVAGWLGWAPVHKAAQGGAVDCMLVLLQLGADANARDQEGQTAMHFAAAAGHLRMVQCLLSPLARAEPDARDEQLYTPLHLAALNGHADIVQLLAASPRVNVNAQTVEGLTPLHAALAGGFARCAELLIDAGARGAALDGQGRTPFAVAKDGDSLARSVVAYQARKERTGETKAVDLVGAVTSPSAAPVSRADAEAASFRLRDGGFVTNRLDQLMVVPDAPADFEDLRHNTDTGSLARHDTFEYQGGGGADDDDDDDDDDDENSDNDIDDKVVARKKKLDAGVASRPQTAAAAKSTPLVSKRRPVANESGGGGGGGVDVGGVVSVSIDTVQPGAAVPAAVAEEQAKGIPTLDEAEEVCSEEVAESGSDEPPRGLSRLSRDAATKNMALQTLSDDSDDGEGEDSEDDLRLLKQAVLKKK